MTKLNIVARTEPLRGIVQDRFTVFSHNLQS